MEAAYATAIVASNTRLIQQDKLVGMYSLSQITSMKLKTHVWPTLFYIQKHFALDLLGFNTFDILNTSELNVVKW